MRYPQYPYETVPYPVSYHEGYPSHSGSQSQSQSQTQAQGQPIYGGYPVQYSHYYPGAYTPIPYPMPPYGHPGYLSHPNVPKDSSSTNSIPYQPFGQYDRYYNPQFQYDSTVNSVNKSNNLNQ